MDRAGADVQNNVQTTEFITMYHSFTSFCFTKKCRPCGDIFQRGLLLCVFALLVCDAAAGLASGLARGLALAATTVFSTCTKVFGFQSFDVFHLDNPPKKYFASIITQARAESQAHTRIFCKVLRKKAYLLFVKSYVILAKNRGKGEQTMGVLAYLFPPVCLGCKSRMLPTAQDILCPACREKWEKEQTKICARCGKRMPSCVCQAQDGVVSRPYPVFSLAAYRHGTVAEQLVLSAKRSADKRLFRLFAEAIAARLRSAGVSCHTAHTVVTYVPRNFRNRMREGQDQGALLASALGECLGVPAMSCFWNRGFISQKKLDGYGRMQHAAKVYRPKSGILSVRGKTVILLDDVCTGGASLSVCYAYLRQAGVARVVCATVAKAGC